MASHGWRAASSVNRSSSDAPCSLLSGRLSVWDQGAIKCCRLTWNSKNVFSQSGGWELSKIKVSDGCPLPGWLTAAFLLCPLVTEVLYLFLLGHYSHHEDSTLVTSYGHHYLPGWGYHTESSDVNVWIQILKLGLISWCHCWGLHSIREYKYCWARDGHYQMLLSETHGPWWAASFWLHYSSFASLLGLQVPPLSTAV